MTKTLTPVTSAACWQGYLVPTGLTGFGSLVPAPVMFATAMVSAPATNGILAASTAAAAHVQAVAGVEQVATAP